MKRCLEHLPGAVTDAASIFTAGDTGGGNGDPFTSDTRSVRAIWPGNSQTVTWNTSFALASSHVQVTTVATSRVRVGYSAAAGAITITRSSGTVADEEFCATIVAP